MLASTFLNQYQVKQSRIGVNESHLWKCVAITEPIGAPITTTGTHTVKKCQAYKQVNKYLRKGFFVLEHIILHATIILSGLCADSIGRHQLTPVEACNLDVSTAT